VSRAHQKAALIAHGGAGAAGPAAERPERQRVMLAAVRAGAAILKNGGRALDAVIATVSVLENHPLFNAGYGSVLNSAGQVEMDASVMEVNPGAPPRAGGVAALSRIRNPIKLARAVMEHSPHLLLVGAGAERFARSAGISLCRPEMMISPRARERRWIGGAKAKRGYGTVGAVAVDAHGSMAAATSTGGMSGKLPGRVEDSAIIGAGTFAGPLGAASATGHGEAIILAGLCREAVDSLVKLSAPQAARNAIAGISQTAGAEAGIILVDRRGRIGYAHNAAMEVATFDPAHGLCHLRSPATGPARQP